MKAEKSENMQKEFKESHEEETENTQSSGHAFARNTAVIAAGTVLSRISGFARIAALTYALGLTLRYGGSDLPNSYNLANSMPNMIFDLVMGGVLISLFIPIYVEYLKNHGKHEAGKIAASITNLAIISLGIFTVIGIAFSDFFVSIMTVFGSYGDAVVEQASVLFKYLIPQIIFYGLSTIYSGILNSHGRFALPAFAPILNNVIVIITVIIYHFMPGDKADGTHLAVLGIGTTLGVVAMALIQLPWVRKSGVKYEFRCGINHPGIRKMLRKSLPLVGYIALWQVATWFSFALAVQEDGGIPSMTYSRLFFMLPYGIFAVSIITALYPTLSGDALKGTGSSANRASWSEYKKTFNLGIRMTLAAMVPSTIAFIVLVEPTIRLLLQRGLFKPQDTIIMAGVLFYFLLGLIPFSIDMLLTKGFYAMQNTLTPLYVNIFTVSVNMASSYILFKSMGVGGLALAFSISYVFAMLLDGWLLRKRIGGLGMKGLLRSFLDISAASALMAAAMKGCLMVNGAALPATGILRDSADLILPLLIGAGTYLAVCRLLKLEEISMIEGAFKKAFKK